MTKSLATKRQRLSDRARIIQKVRAFFIAQGFLEVETPQRIPGNAPEVHIDPINSDGWQLQTSPELAMKRLLAADYGKIFQICRCWRNHERGSKHLPEFSMIEWYRPNACYLALMEDCEQLLHKLIPSGVLSYQQHRIDLAHGCERLSVADAFLRYTDCSAETALKNDLFDELMVCAIEPQLGLNRPTILYDYPAELAALARKKPDQPHLAERFELYIAGLELANAFSELTDPDEQRQRFEADRGARTRAGKTDGPMPEAFLDDLKNLTAAAGIALGLDRLIMLLTDTTCIDDIVCFTPESL